MNTQPVNYDPAELAKFSALAERWWNPELEFRPLHQINPVRLEWIDQHVGLRGKRALDVGCGGGILAEAMAHKGADVKGIDLAEKPLKVAALHALGSQAQVRYQAVSAEDLAEQEPAQYDLVTCMEMLEHVPQPAQVVRACAALAKPGGWVFFSTLNRNPLSWLVAIMGAEYVMGILPKGTHRYSRFIKPRELMAWAHAAGLTVQDSRGLRYNPIAKTFGLNRFLGVGYLLAMRRTARDNEA